MSLLSTVLCKISPGKLDTAWYTASRNRKGHRSPDQHDRFQAWTVSSCSPKFVVIHRGWLQLSKDRQFRRPDVAHAGKRAVSAIRGDIVATGSQPVQRGRVSSANSQWGRASLTWRKLSACRAGTRAGARARLSNLPSKKTIRKQPLFWSPFGGGCEVQSTGARGASINKPDRKRRDRATEID